MFNQRDPLNPTPMSFSRPLPPHLQQGPPGIIPPAFTPFPPMQLFSQGKTLSKGFPILLPTCPVPVHPFAQRDVQEGDWTRFLEDLQIRGRLTGRQRITSIAVPLALNVGFIGGYFLSRGIERHMKRKKSKPVGELVDIWNENFFHSRRIHVILARGPENFSGNVDGPAPDYQGQRSRRGSSSSSSSSSSDDEGGDKQENGGRKREKRADGREKGQERKEKKSEKKQSKREKYRLVILST
ncbi:hypothetical protein BU17DRAFT_46174 [Hysterangium stoloniferum]|nr:hypothetical protein BU17DRAFT_46174 [Hysterangium stoloniferum]